MAARMHATSPNVSGDVVRTSKHPCISDLAQTGCLGVLQTNLNGTTPPLGFNFEGFVGAWEGSVGGLRGSGRAQRHNFEGFVGV